MRVTYAVIVLFLATFSGFCQSFRAVHFNPNGDDNGQEYIELTGTPSSTLTGATIIYIDGDDTQAGIIKTVYSLPTLTFGTNGLILLRDAATVLSPAPSAATTVFVQNFTPDLQNTTGTFMLVTGFTGARNNDIDSDNDGVPNTTVPWTSVLSAVSVLDDLTDLTDRMYAAAFGGTNITKPTSVANSTVPTGIVFMNGVWNAVVTGGSSPGGPYPITTFWTSAGILTTDVARTQLTPGVTAGPLPVTYTYFKGIALSDAINIGWETSSEINASSFELQKSSDAIEFYTIASLAANGNSDSNKNYQFQDKQPIEGINYYRLKQIDQNDTFEYSKIIAVTFGQEAELFTVLGNPVVGDQIQVLIQNLPTNTLKLHTTTGQEIPIMITENGNNYTIQSLKPLIGSLYLLSVLKEGRVYCQKIVVR